MALLSFTLHTHFWIIDRYFRKIQNIFAKLLGFQEKKRNLILKILSF